MLKSHARMLALQISSNTVDHMELESDAASALRVSGTAQGRCTILLLSCDVTVYFSSML